MGDASVAHLVDFSIEDGDNSFGINNSSSKNLHDTVTNYLNHDNCSDLYMHNGNAQQHLQPFSHALTYTNQQSQLSSLEHEQFNMKNNSAINNNGMNSIHNNNECSTARSSSNCTNNSMQNFHKVNATGTSMNDITARLASQHLYNNHNNYLLPIASHSQQCVGDLNSKYHHDIYDEDDGEVFTSADQEVRQVMSATIARTRRHVAVAAAAAATSEPISVALL